MTTPTVTPYKQLRRPLDDRIVAGVCSGIGRYFQVDPVLIRVAFAVLAVLTWGVALLAYPVMWFLIPDAEGPSRSTPPTPHYPTSGAPADYIAPLWPTAPATVHPANPIPSPDASTQGDAAPRSDASTQGDSSLPADTASEGPATPVNGPNPNVV